MARGSGPRPAARPLVAVTDATSGARAGLLRSSGRLSVSPTHGRPAGRSGVFPSAASRWGVPRRSRRFPASTQQLRGRPSCWTGSRSAPAADVLARTQASAGPRRRMSCRSRRSTRVPSAGAQIGTVIGPSDEIQQVRRSASVQWTLTTMSCTELPADRRLISTVDQRGRRVDRYSWIAASYDARSGACRTELSSLARQCGWITVCRLRYSSVASRGHGRARTGAAGEVVAAGDVELAEEHA